jgi:hypothetical protein
MREEERKMKNRCIVVGKRSSNPKQRVKDGSIIGNEFLVSMSGNPKDLIGECSKARHVKEFIEALHPYNEYKIYKLTPFNIYKKGYDPKGE